MNTDDKPLSLMPVPTTMSPAQEPGTLDSKPFSLLVATPSHRGVFCDHYVRSIVGLQHYCMSNGIIFQLKTVTNVSNIDRARNLLAHEFLFGSDATHMLFIDDDMGFDVDDVWKMLAHRDEADVVGAMYPGKSIDWSRVKATVLANPDIEAPKLAEIAASFVNMWTLGKDDALVVGDVPIRLQGIATGAMLISRACLLSLIENRLVRRIAHFFESRGEEGLRTLNEFFCTTIGADGKPLGEDFFFCGLVNANNGKVVGCPWVRTTHLGSYAYKGDLKSVARNLAK